MLVVLQQGYQVMFDVYVDARYASLVPNLCVNDSASDVIMREEFALFC